MKKSIVFKWFVLTILLFTVTFLFIGIMQNYFFEKYYINKKSDTLGTYMDEYVSLATEKGSEAASLELYKNNNIWVVKLDGNGFIDDVQDYYIEVNLGNGSQGNLRIPMYSFEGYFSDMISLLKVDDEVIIDTVNIADEKIPYLIQTNIAGFADLNIANKLHGPNAEQAYSHLETGLYRGMITKTVFPERTEYIPFPYQEHYFLEQVKEFQVGLIANDAKALQHTEELSATENFTEYKIIIKPVIENGGTVYIFAMTSLQPVDEAMAVIRQFYPYFFGFTLLCVVFLAFVFSKWLAKPLLSINQVTGKIANLDFSETLPVRSEINRVITNLLSNAIQHTENGHTIVISMKSNGQIAEISVENQGNPISEDDIKLIWNQFYRAESRTSKAGTGLGLSISKGILELHHSNYGIENTKDGVRFFFTLPILP